MLLVASGTTAARAADPTPTASALGGVVPPGRLIDVPADVASLRAAIDVAQPGDVIQLAAGTYDGGIVIPEEKHDLTIRGVDRNAVVFFGKGFRLNAIEVEADRVTLENMSAYDFDGNGFYWEGVEGFTARYLTVWDLGLYGIYATTSHGGVIEHSLVSGAADAAFYIGECRPCDTEIRDVEGRLSAIGYSGTNTGPGTVVRDSVWDRNGTGILPNSFEGQALPPPERASRFEHNVVRDSGRVPVPANSPLAGFSGIGIGIAGGQDNAATGNTITGSSRYGVAVFPTLQESGNVIVPSGNTIEANTISSSGIADLGITQGAGPNCFHGNTFEASLPSAIESKFGCTGGPSGQGDPRVSGDLAIPVPEALDRLAAQGPRPAFNSMPKPEPAPNSPDPLPPGLGSFRETSSPILVAGGVALLAVVVLGLFVAWRVLVRRRVRRHESAG